MRQLKIVQFFNREYEGSKRRIIAMSCISGLSFPLMVYVVNQAALSAAAGSTDADFRIFFMYVVICALILVTKRYALTQTTIMAESVVRKVRVRLIDKIRRTDLAFMERLGKGDVRARLTQDTDLISFTASDVMYVFDGILSAAGLFIYAASVSLPSFLFVSIFLVLLFGAYFFNYRIISRKLHLAREKEGRFFDALDDVLSGFKEIKINRGANDDLFADIESISHETETLKTEAGYKSNRNILLSFVLYEGLLAVVVFLVPLVSGARSDVVIQLVAMMLFVYGTLNGISRGMPVVFTTNVAVENIERLESRIDAFGPLADTVVPESTDFNRIGLHQVSYRYTGEMESVLFEEGPIDLTIQKGEVLFLVGGNGSGKSTLLKLITGLYYPMQDGSIQLNGRAVTQDNYQAYRELFSTVFTDYHLFRKLYGLETVDEKRVSRLLGEMALHAKTEYRDGAFTNLDLSRGQGKRLAYIAALLEDRPIYVLDEWAADQDPEFRIHFYDRFLQDLRAMGKTVIAASHDDRFFDRADRVIKMEEGKIVEIMNPLEID